MRFFQNEKAFAMAEEEAAGKENRLLVLIERETEHTLLMEHPGKRRLTAPFGGKSCPAVELRIRKWGDHNGREKSSPPGGNGKIRWTHKRKA